VIINKEVFTLLKNRGGKLYLRTGKKRNMMMRKPVKAIENDKKYFLIETIVRFEQCEYIRFACHYKLTS
jgi:hypothetical protein